MMSTHLNQLISQFLVLIILVFGIKKHTLIFQMICHLALMVKNVFARGIGYMVIRGNKVMEMNFIVSFLRVILSIYCFLAVSSLC